MKKIAIIFLVFVMVLSLSGCADSANDTQRIQTERLLQESNSVVGMPNIVNFTEKKQLKDIYELCDQTDLITYTYTKSTMSGKYVFEGQSIGYGVPFSAQFSNPETLSRFVEGKAMETYTWEMAPQAEPNGIFKPTSSMATWVILIDPVTGERNPAYYEPEIVVRQKKIPANLCEDWSIPTDY